MSPQSYTFVTLDVFTSTPYSGNPVAIVFLPHPDPLTQAQKQLVAREFNLTETVFFHAPDATDVAKAQQRISIFTTWAEIPFAGHPTVGSASWLLVHSRSQSAEGGGSRSLGALLNSHATTLVTKAGPIPVGLSEGAASDGGGGAKMVKAMIPQNMHLHSTRVPAKELLRLHPSLAPYVAADASFPVVSIVRGMTATLVPLASLTALAAVAIASGGATIPTSSTADGGYLDPGWETPDHLARYFYVLDVPDETLGRNVIRSRMCVSGIEDPATGSAASSLTTWLSLFGPAVAQRQEEGDLREYHVVQGVEMGRRSDIGIKVKVKDVDSNRKGIESVELSGCAVLISEGSVWV